MNTESVDMEDDNFDEEEVQEDLENNYEEKQPTTNIMGNPCPECGEPLIHEGGCDVCRNCGYSHCG